MRFSVGIQNLQEMIRQKHSKISFNSLRLFCHNFNVSPSRRLCNISMTPLNLQNNAGGCQERQNKRLKSVFIIFYLQYTKDRER